jgi:hypothetical protein
MTLEQVCLEYDRLTRLRDSLKAALADYQPPPSFTQQEVDFDRRTSAGRSTASTANCIG